MQTYQAILLLLLSYATPKPGWGRDTLFLRSDQHHFSLSEHAQFKTTEASQTLSAVFNTLGWGPASESATFDFASTLWIKTTISNPDTVSKWFFLKPSCCYHVDVYIARNSTSFQPLVPSKDAFDGVGIDLSNQKFVPIRINPEELITAIIKLKKIQGIGSRPGVNRIHQKVAALPEITLYSYQGFVEHAHAALLNELPFIQVVTLFQGAVGFSMVFFMFLYFKNRQKIYLFYAAYLVCFLVYALLLTRPFLPGGHWISAMGWIKQPIQEGFNWLGLAMYIFFSASLLDMKRLAPLGNKRLKLLAYLIIAYAFLVLTLIPAIGNTQILQVLFIISRAVGLTLNLVILVWIYYKFTSPLKIYLLIGNSFIFISGTVASLITLGSGTGILKDRSIGNSEAILIYLVGIILEVITFSFALGYRIKINEEERNKSKEAYIEQLTLNQNLIQQTNLELEQKLQEHTNRLTEQFNALEKEREEKIKSSYEKDLAYAKIQALHSQMNPHFLFNALNSIELAIQKGKKDEAVVYLSKFTRLLRLILQHTRSEKISLKEELESVRLYLDLESWRFGEGFKYSIYLDETIDPESISVPPLLIQPFVENAIWHGLMHSEKEEKILSIKAFKEGGCLGFFIEDNGIGMKKSNTFNKNNSKTRKSLGIALVNDRVSLFNKQSHQQLEFQHIDKLDGETSEGTIVKICLKTRDHD